MERNIKEAFGSKVQNQELIWEGLNPTVRQEMDVTEKIVCERVY